ncbi:MAG: argonaute/piwi family protein [Gammaproteobacteria bacterium]
MGKRHPETIRVGFVGTGESIESALGWLKSCSEGVPGDDKNYRFSGFKADRGFFSELSFEDETVEKLTFRELEALGQPRTKRERFEQTVDLLSDKLRLLAQRDRPPEYVVLALPKDLVKARAKVDYFDKQDGEVHRDLRRAIKAVAMKQRLPTQILLPRTTEATPNSKDVDHRSKCAWNFFTGLYYKSGGIPWTPSGLSSGTCYVGISFHRAPGSKNSSYFTGLAQAFDEQGNGLVLRGQDFVWEASKHGNSPHMPAQLAEELVSLVLKRYRDEMKQSPRRVVIHKTTEYWPEERQGLQAALNGIDQFDLVAVCPTEDVRLLRDARYPILRGSHVSLGDMHLLYTTGFISALQAFPHGHVPLPLKLTDHVGDSSVKNILHELMVLTKMNWNSANFGGLLPITLRFSRLVGEIMKEVPRSIDPLPQFKYYM